MARTLFLWLCLHAARLNDKIVVNKNFEYAIERIWNKNAVINIRLVRLSPWQYPKFVCGVAKQQFKLKDIYEFGYPSKEI